MNRSPVHGERDARLALSLVCEPGDPRLPDAVASVGATGVLDAVGSGRQLGPHPWPEAWTQRTRRLDPMMTAVARRAADAGLRWVCPGETGWPTALDDLDHLEPLHGATGTPLGLWLRGTADLAELCLSSVAVVGARDCTPYGAEAAAEVAADVADAGFTVVSGAAYGIDAAAHRGALAMDRPTVAVLACGADADYPRSHAALLRRVGDDGLVVSEQPPGQVPIKARFLSRNRLIAALARGTVVVEARVRSGSLNTLNWADRLGRPTMAVPGPVTSQQSGGTHRAVRDGKAVLVTGGTDVVTEVSGLGVEDENEWSGPSTEFDHLPAPAQRALDTLSWRRLQSPREVATTAGLGPHQVGPALALLQRRGLACRVGDGWQLVRRADLV